MTSEYYQNLCEAGSLLCGFCGDEEGEECECCMVNRLLADAFIELPDENDENDDN